jgi:hypothetical protein
MAIQLEQYPATHGFIVNVRQDMNSFFKPAQFRHGLGKLRRLIANLQGSHDRRCLNGAEP